MQKTKTRTKLHAITLNENLDILKEIFTETELPFLHFTYVAIFHYSQNKINKIEINDYKGNIVCTISYLEIKKISIKELSHTNNQILLEEIKLGNLKSFKKLFLKKCLCQ